MSRRDPGRLRIKVSGSAVGSGRLAVRDLTEIAARLELVLKRIGQVLHQGASGGRGRRTSEIERSCSLDFVSWERGSAIAGFEPSSLPEQLALFGDLNERSMAALVDGLTVLEGDGHEAGLPPGFDAGVLESVESLGGALEHGIERLEFALETEVGIRRSTYNARVRERVGAMRTLPPDPERCSVNGRLETLSGHDALGGQLWQADGTRWVCTFKPEHIESLASAWMSIVTLYGKGRFDEKASHGRIEVDRLVVEDAHPGAAAEEEWPFWTSMSLDEIAAQQGVSPIAALDDLTADWPEDAYPDEDPLAEVLHDRSTRRARVAG